ncbi:phosphatidic acid phosphatase [Siphonobacter sp. BAB-5385]|uniref:vanadium-dependent haloperoxidase n=1 Tax=Siphonobacter sp. BAB-5385 TaxID=1864822 RepID=UPI000B9EA695|nr:vanadium-dependent haloperoxidase [Siphonobacter sp. BAB-5385]OZI07879.1 phosphatidic acid phosphatase [Siphonobacter sp. BAB-5385]
MNKIRLVIILLSSLFGQQSFAQYTREAFERILFHEAQDALTRVIVSDIFSPPVASRIYVYAHVAAYETLMRFEPKTYQSLAGQLRGLSSPAVQKTSHAQAGLAATEALLMVGRGLVFSEQALEEEAATLWKRVQQRGYTAEEIRESKAMGQQMAQHILAWAGTDQYKQTRSLRRYAPLKKEGSWLPTPPAYMPAVEPYWGRIKPMVLDSSTQYQLSAPPVYSISPESAFYHSAQDVQQAGLHLTEEQRLIANYWDCNPFFLHTQGHMHFGSKKLSPNGHWMSIAGQVARQLHTDLYRTSSAYVLTALAIFDGFITCWQDKYTYNVIRPETYINAHISESWKPILQTPPFPEYPSGHSVISTAAAVVLDQVFGSNVAFHDSTEVPYGLPVRHFASFTQAAQEAAVSRLYGGIHYREAIVNGQQQGFAVGQALLRKVKWKK